jgi:hypothetical protein
MTTRTIVERLPSVIITLALTLILGTVAMAVSPRFRGFIRPPSPPAYAAGDLFEAADLLTSGASNVLVVVAGPNCGAADRVHDFLAQAVTAATSAGATPWLYTVEAAHPETAAYAARLGISADHIVAVNIATTKVKSMPTVALLNRDHRVLHYWPDAPDPQASEGILGILRSTGRQ